MFRRLVLYSFFLLMAGAGHAQEITVQGKFMTDSVRLGEPVQFYLTARYPSERQLLFPDSTFSFAPFEFQKKKFFTTTTANNQSYDSAVYTLNSFEIEPIQLLKLPAFILLGADCTAYYTDTDTLFFKNMVKKGDVPDSLAANQLPLKTDTTYRAVSWMLNYPLVLILLGGLIILLVILWNIFGDRIIRSVKLKRLQKSHAAFLARFDKTVYDLKEQFSPHSAEQAIALWKEYMEDISKIPYTKYTTQEIKHAFPNNDIALPLASVDRMVYGGMRPETLDSFQQLKSEAEKTFQQKVAQPNVSAPPPRQFTIFEAEEYAELIRALPCPVCGSTAQKLNGTVVYTVKSFILLTVSKRKQVIACPTCLNRKNNLAIVSTALLGWWGIPWGFINTPYYIYLNLESKKQIKSEGPNETMISFVRQHADMLETYRDNKEVLTILIKK